MITTRIRDESGSSLVELAVTFLVTSVMGASLIAWIGSAGTAAGLHSEDDRVVQELRVAKERLARDLRVGSAVLVAQAAAVAVWVDGDEDGYQDPGEEITWWFEDGGLLRRTDLEGGHVEASSVDEIRSHFSYDATEASAVERVSVTLVSMVSVRYETPSPRTLTVSVQVRNAP